MKIPCSTAIALMAWLIALSSPASVNAADEPVRIEISIAENVPFRGAIVLTIKYTNTSAKAVRLQ